MHALVYLRICIVAGATMTTTCPQQGEKHGWDDIHQDSTPHLDCIDYRQPQKTTPNARICTHYRKNSPFPKQNRIKHNLANLETCRSPTRHSRCTVMVSALNKTAIIPNPSPLYTAIPPAS